MFAKGLVGEIFFPLKSEIQGRKDLFLFLDLVPSARGIGIATAFLPKKNYD